MTLVSKLQNKMMNYYDNTSKKKLIQWIIIAICIYSTFLLILPGIPKGHDLSFHLARISAIKDGLALGQFPVTIYPNYLDGYGYANGLFYADIFLYIPAILSLLGLEVITSYKIFLVLCTVATALAMYICVKSISKSDFAAIISTILYTLASYRIADVYIRAATGEILSFIFLPIIILGIYKIIYSNYKQWYILTFGFAGIFLSHNISAVIMVGFTALILLFSVKRLVKDPKRIGYFALATVVTILLVGFFLFPMVEQLLMGRFIVNTETVSSELWNTTMPIFKIIFEFPYTIIFMPGMTGIGIVLIFVSLMRIKVRKQNNQSFIYSDICLAMGVLSLVAVTKIFPWKLVLSVIPQLGAIQFSWRLFLTATVFLAISGGIILFKYCDTKKKKVKFFSIVLVLAMFGSGINMFAQYAAYGYYQYTGINQIDLSDYSIGLGEYMPEGTDKELLYKRGEIITSNNDLDLEFEKKGNKIDIQFANNKGTDTYIEVPLLYYLGYEAKYITEDKEEKLEVSAGENNVIRINLNENESGKISISYKGTPVQNIAQIISLITLIILIIFLVYKKKNTKD